MYNKSDDFVSDGICVDWTPVSSLIVDVCVADLQVPLAHLRPLDTKPRVVDDTSIFVRQRNRFRVQPRHLQLYQQSLSLLRASDTCSKLNLLIYCQYWQISFTLKRLKLKISLPLNFWFIHVFNLTFNFLKFFCSEFYCKTELLKHICLQIPVSSSLSWTRSMLLMLLPNVWLNKMTVTLNLPRESMAHGRVAVSPLITVTLLSCVSNSGSMPRAVPHKHTVNNITACACLNWLTGVICLSQQTHGDAARKNNSVHYNDQQLSFFCYTS